ncbi:MAG: hypothetical protein E6Q37_02665 [Crocinitomicaceae bacterium]|jgi:antitoxin component YwqK of YwqJK toxin-antitoxin module|nr:MAG: hypothetical protein E6Q37_02665 [Crocinitomicaceae bacterium]
MFKYVVAISLAISVVGCTEKEETAEKPKIEKKEDLVVVKNGLFTEYYPGKKQVKFQGQQDELKQRHGRWTFYSESGIELSITHYIHGVKHGHTIVKYPNGNMHYVGEYDNGKEIGKWQMYDEQGNVTVTDYDALN